VHSITEDVCDEEVCGIDIRQDCNDDLPDNYRELAAKIFDGLRMDPARVYLSEIPDVTRNEFGQYCGWDTAPTSTAGSWWRALRRAFGVTATARSIAGWCVYMTHS